MSATTFKERLRADLKAAMQAREANEVRVLRTLIAALDNAEAVPGQDRPRDRRPAPGDPSCEVARLELDAHAVASLLANEVAARRTAAAEYRQGGRRAEADALLAEIALVERYL
jgi:uncharacterized protein YqeY